jgi:crotonobetainyl-CoA:carnitine CoA-transferase CaiB-like acyl-CoA transferase
MAGALDGIRVLDLSTLVQGPQAAAMLHDLGADVIKIELPDVGDVGRHVDVLDGLGHSSVFIACNRGKRSVTLDLRRGGGKRAFEKLVETADVVLSNFAPGTLDGWGLGYEDLSRINPRLIWAAGSYLGPHGPESHREGADMAGQAIGGLIATTGREGGPMTPVGALIADHCGAQNLVTAILAALFARTHTGRGQRVDVSLLGGQIWAQATEYTHVLLTGEPTGRSNGGHPLIHALYGIYPTADGYVAIAGCPPHLWPAMVKALDKPEWIDHPRFATLFVTPEVEVEMREAFSTVFRTRTTAEWTERLTDAGQRFAPVRTHAEVGEDPQPYANGYLAEVDHPQWGRVRVVGNPITMTGTPTRVGVEVAELGQHTEEVLLEAGFAWSDIDALRAEGAF